MKLQPYEVPEGDRDLLDCGRVIDPDDCERFPRVGDPQRRCACPGCPHFVPGRSYMQRGAPGRLYCCRRCLTKAARLRREARDAAGIPRQSPPEKWRKAAATVAAPPLAFDRPGWFAGQTLGEMFPVDYDEEKRK